MPLKHQNIGVIGLGLMGAPMARNILQAGAGLTVFNRTAAKAEPLLARGARLAAGPGDLAQRVAGGIIVICVSDTPAMADTIAQLTQKGLTGTLVIDMGTTTVAATMAAASQVAAKGGGVHRCARFGRCGRGGRGHAQHYGRRGDGQSVARTTGF